MAKAKYEEWLKPDSLILLQGWARDGLTMEQIAHNMGINAATLYVWRRDHQEIDKALQKSREICYYEVENALYKSAMGYDAKEIEQIENYDANGDLISKSKRVRTRHIPPNTGAICFILKNRRAEQWQEKPEKPINENVKDDGFLDALNGSAADDWQDDENTADEESGDLNEE